MKAGWAGSWRGALGGVLSSVIILLTWELLTGWLAVVDQRLLPPPSKVVRSIVEMSRTGELWTDLRSSAFRYVAGYVLGLILGIALGMGTGLNRVARVLLNPIINLARSTPSVALLPLAIVWFGIGDEPKIFIITWGVLFPFWLNTYIGIGEIDQRLIWTARSLGAKGYGLLVSVYFPSTLPFIIAGARMAIATAFFSLAAAEMGGGYSGIAFRIFHSHGMFQNDRMLAALLVLAGLAFAADKAFVAAARHFFPWWQQQDISSGTR